ncbi:hypothetical protein ANN_09423, partial [Periplaneta americana]
LTSWYTSSQTTHPPAYPEFQKQWDVIFSQKNLDTLLSSFKSEQDIARLLALQESESGAWLHALPSPHIGTLIDSTSFKIAIALRLGCKLCQPHQCICGGIADIYGYHALSCARSKGRIPRHTSLNDIKRSLTSCGIPSLLEPPGISRADGKRPDSFTLIPWSRGKSLIWDSTCVDTLAPFHLPNTSRHAASAAELAVKKKVNKYVHLLDNYIFVPFAVETFGPWSHDAKVLVSQIGQILISITGDRRCTTYLRQRLSIAIQRGNAMSVLGTLPESSPLDELFLLADKNSIKHTIMRVLLFKTIAPGIPLPPQPVLILWKTWLDAVNYYAEYYGKIMEAIYALDSTDSSAVAVGTEFGAVKASIGIYTAICLQPFIPSPPLHDILADLCTSTTGERDSCRIRTSTCRLAVQSSEVQVQCRKRVYLPLNGGSIKMNANVAPVRSGGIRRADIVALDKTNSKGFILDPTVRFEMSQTQPSEVNKEKQQIYEPTIPYFREKYQMEGTWEVHGLMIGARGTIPRSTVNTIKTFGIHDIIPKIITSTIKGTDLDLSTALAYQQPATSFKTETPDASRSRFIDIRCTLLLMMKVLVVMLMVVVVFDDDDDDDDYGDAMMMMMIVIEPNLSQQSTVRSNSEQLSDISEKERKEESSEVPLLADYSDEMKETNSEQLLVSRLFVTVFTCTVEGLV